MNNSVYLAKPFKKFIFTMMLVSAFGGYLLSQYIYRMDDYFINSSEKLLRMEGSIGDANIALGKQIQEWKNMLLRANDTELYSKHKKAFFENSSDVQHALQLTKSSMQNEGMDTSEIEQLLIDHQSLLSDYLMAKSSLNPLQIDSFREADKQVVGVDRRMQEHITAVKSEIQHFSNQQLKEKMLSQGDRYMLGLVGAFSLLLMSLVGFAFATRSHIHSTSSAEHKPTT